jgi:hypothetical protein
MRNGCQAAATEGLIAAAAPRSRTGRILRWRRLHDSQRVQAFAAERQLTGAARLLVRPWLAALVLHGGLHDLAGACHRDTAGRQGSRFRPFSAAGR